jgi:Ca-activated chloride channel family protein
MKFYNPYWLAAIAVLLPACIFLLRWGARRTRANLDRIIAPRLHEQLLRSVDYGKRQFKWALFLLGLTFLLAAIARPLFGYRELKIERAGVDLIVALDISKSMLAPDAGATNRLNAAKESIVKLLARPNGDRIGLIAFAGEAYLMAPVTLDHNAVRRSLAALTPTAISKPGSDIAAAIKLAARSFDEKQKDGKALIILSDGEELQGEAVIAAREISTKGISIFTVGVGTTTGSKLPELVKPNEKQRFVKNEFGNEVFSKMNERVLQQIAVAGHGFYAQLGPEGEGLFTVDDRGLRPLAKGTQTRLSKDMREYFQWPLGVGIALLFWELLVNERRKRI